MRHPHNYQHNTVKPNHLTRHIVKVNNLTRHIVKPNHLTPPQQPAQSQLYQYDTLPPKCVLKRHTFPCTGTVPTVTAQLQLCRPRQIRHNLANHTKSWRNAPQLPIASVFLVLTLPIRCRSATDSQPAPPRPDVPGRAWTQPGCARGAKTGAKTL